MKKITTYCSACLLSFASLFASAIDIAPSNLSSNNYYGSYDGSTKTIKNINFTVTTDGTNSLNRTSALSIKLYLLVPGGENPIFIHTISVPNGLKELTATEYSAIDVNISNVPNLATGTYRLGVFVDADRQISESNESNNAILFEGEINYTAGVVVTEKPDLVIDSYAFSYKNKILSMDYVKIKNIGAANAMASDLKILVEDKDGNSSELIFSIDAINSGTTLTVNPDDIDLTMVPDGTILSLKLTADPENKVSESNEDNNTKLASEDISKGPLSINVHNNTADQQILFQSTHAQLNITSAMYLNIAIYDTNGNKLVQVCDGTVSQGTQAYGYTLQPNQVYIAKIKSTTGGKTQKFYLQ